MPRFLLAFVVAISACGPPRYVESVEQIDGFLSRGDFASACVGLKMSDEYVRGYAAEQLAKYGKQDAATDCLCDEVYDAEAGTWDPVIARGLAESRLDKVAACLAKAVPDTRIKDGKALMEALGAIVAPSGFEALEAAVRQSPDPEVRAAAVRGLQASNAHATFLETLLASEKDASVRAAAATAMAGRTESSGKDALLKALRTDEEPEVRLAAIGVLKGEDKVSAIDAICDALMQDADASVRAAAAAAFAGTKSARAGKCLVKRLSTYEESGTVREAVLEATKSSPQSDVRQALCDLIPAYTRMYIKDKVAQDIEGSNLVWAQNFNEFERSYECVQRALAQGGYSCYGRNYLAHWFNELGGSAKAPWCPGMPQPR